MKICNCGYENHDEDNFCKQCGSPLEAQQQTTNPFPMLSALKAKGGSAGFLIAVILFTLTLVMTIVSAFSVRAQMAEVINTIAMYAGMTGEHVDMSEAYEIIYQVAPFMTVFTILCSIPTIIICIGLWCIYGTCKKSGNQPLKTGGFTAIKVILILNMIGTCISYALVVFMLVFIFLSAAAEGISFGDLMYMLEMYGVTYGEADAIAGILSGAFIFVILLLIVIMVLSIVYLAKMIGCLNRAKEIIVTGKTSKNVSAFVGVFLMIGGVLNALSGLIGLDIATILSGVTSIIFAALLFSIRGAINRAR